MLLLWGLSQWSLCAQTGRVHTAAACLTPSFRHSHGSRASCALQSLPYPEAAMLFDFLFLCGLASVAGGYGEFDCVQLGGVF